MWPQPSCQGRRLTLHRLQRWVSAVGACPVHHARGEEIGCHSAWGPAPWNKHCPSAFGIDVAPDYPVIAPARNSGGVAGLHEGCHCWTRTCGVPLYAPGA
ncbi:hypothetical protein NDU88_006010 [Pleurodeles waltl]|uniref:Uncharacterized protein n=1 Tax=Pleurodeles waltl TaxID=8319 RepID=A0AAV7W9D7_PLEWA|nr:hypothetical protein NDU88_006010 [Pleurodeles waltl]